MGLQTYLNRCDHMSENNENNNIVHNDKTRNQVPMPIQMHYAQALQKHDILVNMMICWWASTLPACQKTCL